MARYFIPVFPTNPDGTGVTDAVVRVTGRNPATPVAVYATSTATLPMATPIISTGAQVGFWVDDAIGYNVTISGTGFGTYTEYIEAVTAESINQLLKSSVPPAGQVKIFGHSYAASGGASSGQGYSAKLAGNLGAKLVTYAIGGAKVGHDDQTTSGGISWMAQKIHRNVTRAPYTPGENVIVLHWGINDIWALGMNPQGSTPATVHGQSIYKNAMRTAIALARSSVRFFAGDKTTNLSSTITLATPTSWTNVANPSQPVGRGGSGAISGSVGFITTRSNSTPGQVKITIPGDYPGSLIAPIYVMSVATPSQTSGILTASGAATGTFDLVQTKNGTSGTCDVANNSCNLITWRFASNTIAPSGGIAQTLTITPSGINPGSGWCFAEWGIEAGPDKPVVVVPGLDYLNPAILISSKVRNSDVQAWDSTLQNLILTEFSDDPFTIYVPIGLGGSGNTLGAFGTAGNATPARLTTSLSATPVSSINITSAAPVPVSGIGTLFGTEYLTWTGRQGASPVWTLTSVNRGVYNTGIGGQSAGTLFDVLNLSALHNFSNDSTHPSDDGHTVYAKQILSFITPFIGKNISPQITGNGIPSPIGIFGNSWTTQIIPPQGGGFGAQGIALKHNQVFYDSSGGGMVDVAAGPGIISLIGTYDKIFLPNDGVYDTSVFGPWTYGKVTTGSSVAGGIRYLAVQLNGVNVGIEQLFIGADTADLPNSIFLSYQTLRTVPFIGKKGDYIQVFAFQGNVNTSGSDSQGVLTTLSSSVSTPTSTSWSVTSGTGINNNEYLRCDDEAVLVTAGGGTATLTVSRAQLGTNPATHSNGVNVWTGVGFGNQVVPIRVVVNYIKPV